LQNVKDKHADQPAKKTCDAHHIRVLPLLNLVTRMSFLIISIVVSGRPYILECRSRHLLQSVCASTSRPFIDSRQLKIGSMLVFFDRYGRIKCSFSHKRNLANNNGEGGGQNLQWVLGTLFYNESNLKEGKVGPIERKFFVFFSLSFLFATIHFSNQKNS
jgi:hypothetical protein